MPTRARTITGAAIVLAAVLFALYLLEVPSTGGGEADRAVQRSVSAVTLVAAGDIADCGGAEGLTADLVASLDATVVAPLGDLAYPDGSAEDFQRCYRPSWGAFADRSKPALGNHDVRTEGADPFHDTFGPGTGRDRGGYYSYELGAWHIVVLNSNCDAARGCGEGSAQLSWLVADLEASGSSNVLAYWHHPRFSTGAHGDDERVAAFWDALYAAGADVVLNGHDHDYERSAPMSPAGVRDERGVRQFVVGTGGTGLRPFSSDRDTVEFRQAGEHGVLRLDLEDCGYRWAFLPVGGGEALDVGVEADTCR